MTNQPPPLFDFSGFSAEGLTALRDLGSFVSGVIKGALVAFGFLNLERAAVRGDTFTTAFGSIPTKKWSYKFGGAAGPPPPLIDLYLEANLFVHSLSPLILGAGG